MSIIVRFGQAQFREFTEILFARYPREEWATFAFAGWHDTDEDLVVSLARLNPAVAGELNEHVGHVQFREPYSLRTALEAEALPLAVVVAHSHPRGCMPLPSDIDDDMDEYFADYFSGFAPDRPYISLIASSIDDEYVLGGRVLWQGKWHPVDRFIVEAVATRTVSRKSKSSPSVEFGRVRRLADAFGKAAALRLRESTVALIGLGGTGSAAVEVLARAGVGHLILIDDDEFHESNLERVHGSIPSDANQPTLKIAIARRHILSIDPSILVTAISGLVPQSLTIDAIAMADVALGCTDSHASRVSLAELAWRYAVPVIDAGVTLEGACGSVTGQIAQLVRFGPSHPCAICQGMYDPRRVTRELMSPEERAQRRAAALEAIERGESPDPYWADDEPQLNTVGYLTTTAGALAAGYAIGMITGRFVPPFARLQTNFVAPWWDVTDQSFAAVEDCTCQRYRGWSDQSAQYAIASAPSHWKEPVFLPRPAKS